MQELLGRLTSVDPAAGESLRVVAYFDTLIARDAGIDALVGGAAVLSGEVAGARVHGRSRRRDPEGNRLPEVTDTSGFPRRTGHGWEAWIERQGEPRAVEEMILDRLAVALEQAEARRRPTSGLGVALDGTQEPADRLAALAALQVSPESRVRLIATPADAPDPAGPSTVVPTRYGLLRATLTTPSLRGTTEHLPTRGGVGIWTDAEHAPDSWRAAVIALRLGDPATMPVVDAADLGAMLLLAESYDPQSPPADVTALLELDTRRLQVLQALASADSIRSAAHELGMHHSTVQARHEDLTERLGYDPRTVTGRMRYLAAAMLARLTTPGQI